MPKTRLTNADREAISRAIILHKFTPIEAALKAEEAALAVQSRIKAYGDYLPTIEAAPPGAFMEVGVIKLNIDGKQIALSFGGPRARIFDAHDPGYGHKVLTLTGADAFGRKVVAWAERSEATKAEKNTLRSNLTGTLAAFNSFDDLQKGWPEADRFITERWRARPDYAANVPAVALRDLSAALDLPPELEAAA